MPRQPAQAEEEDHHEEHLDHLKRVECFKDNKYIIIICKWGNFNARHSIWLLSLSTRLIIEA